MKYLFSFLHTFLSMSVLLSALILFSGCHDREVSKKPKKDTSAKKSVSTDTNNTVTPLNEKPDIYLEKPEAINFQPYKESASFILNGKLYSRALLKRHTS